MSKGEATFWMVVLGLILGIFISVQIYYSGREAKIVEMVKAGASPLEAMCALTDVQGDDPICVILATGKYEEKK